MDYRVRIVRHLLIKRFSATRDHAQIAADHHLNLLLDEMAKEVELSPSHLCALFKAATGQTFSAIR